MEIQIQPYLFFDGRCEEAVAFYQEALGAEVVMLMRYRDSPQQAPGSVPPGGEDKVMHGALKIGEASLLVGRSVRRAAQLQGLLGGAVGARCRHGRAPVRCPGGGRAGADTPGAHLLLAGLRHGGRQVRRALDGRRPPLERVRRDRTRSRIPGPIGLRPT